MKGEKCDHVEVAPRVQTSARLRAPQKVNPCCRGGVSTCEAKGSKRRSMTESKISETCQMKYLRPDSVGHGGAIGGDLVSIGARLRGALIRSWRPTELFDQNAAEHRSQKWHCWFLFQPKSHHVETSVDPVLQGGAAMQTYPKLTTS